MESANKIIIKDKFYYKACEDAKEDFHLMGIQRTDKQVEYNADKMRKED